MRKFPRFFDVCRLCASLFYLAFYNLPAKATNEAVGVYAAYESSVFQVRIIELGSGSQSALGTGFLVGDGTWLATNYHVISAKVFEPNKYRIEIEYKKNKISLTVLAVDVINDLAILKINNAELQVNGDDAPHPPLGKPFVLQPSLPAKGTTLYSLGNPHDIGMTVVPGSFNGLVEHRFVDQIHFSGAINPGMSGGPVLDLAAHVVGINVATAGNQIGFLVPAKALVNLVARAPSKVDDKTPIFEDIANQIGEHTTQMISAALSAPWESTDMGIAKIQSSPLIWLECWGDSNRDKKKKTYTISRGCHSGSPLFLSHTLNSGYMEYEFLFFEAPTWPSVSVYDFLAKDTSQAVPANSGSKKDLGAYECHDRQVKNKSAVTLRVSHCVRNYKKLPGLYDAFYMAISVDKSQQAVMSHYTLAGVQKVAAQRFLEHFLEVV